MKKIKLVIAIIRAYIWFNIFLLFKGVTMLFDLSTRKSGTVLANIGTGSVIITVEFAARYANVEFVTRKDHVNCHHALPDWIKIEVIEAKRRRSRLKISWHVKHQSLARYVVTG
jgi:hypothetical protein